MKRIYLTLLLISICFLYGTAQQTSNSTTQQVQLEIQMALKSLNQEIDKVEQELEQNPSLIEDNAKEIQQKLETQLQSLEELIGKYRKDINVDEWSKDLRREYKIGIKKAKERLKRAEKKLKRASKIVQSI